jgi:hypothetical protein
MSEPGQLLRIVGNWDGNCVTRVQLENRAPLATTRLVGRTPAEARRLAPVIFTRCGRTQALAVEAACAAAEEGWSPPQAPDPVRERDAACDIASEHLWRLLLDWPVLFGYAPRRHRFGHLHSWLARVADDESAKLLGGELLDLVAGELLSGFFRSLREPHTLSVFEAYCRSGGAIGEPLADLLAMGASIAPDEARVPFLPVRSAQSWAESLGGMPSAAFCAAPELDGRPAETGPLARQAHGRLADLLIRNGHCIAARLFAAALDLAEAASRLRRPPGVEDDLPPLMDAAPLGPGMGLARLETARGLLLHAVRLDGGRIAEYAIIGPAEWNFHPRGAFACESAGWSAPDRRSALLRLRVLVLSLDPGVGFEVALRGPEIAGGA